MSLAPIFREVATSLADAWWVAVDAFSAADLLPLLAVWGLGLVTAEGCARLDAAPSDMR